MTFVHRGCREKILFSTLPGMSDFFFPEGGVGFRLMSACTSSLVLTLSSQRHLHSALPLLGMFLCFTAGLRLSPISPTSGIFERAKLHLSSPRDELTGQTPANLRGPRAKLSAPSSDNSSGLGEGLGSISPVMKEKPPVTRIVQITSARQHRPMQVITTDFFLKPKHGPSSAIPDSGSGLPENTRLRIVVAGVTDTLWHSRFLQPTKPAL